MTVPSERLIDAGYRNPPMESLIPSTFRDRIDVLCDIDCRDSYTR